MPAQKKKVSKNKKIAWRKHSRFEDVEEFLEDQRFEDRLGLKFESLRNEDLFEIATSSDQNTNKGRSKKTANKIPRCFQHISIALTQEKESKVKRLNPKKAKSVYSKKKQTEKIAGCDKEKREALLKLPDRDIWEGSENNQISDWLERDQLKHNLKNLGMYTKQVPETLKSLSTALSRQPKTAVPHPGLSYNPNHNDYLELLNKVKEEKAIKTKETERIKRLTQKPVQKKVVIKVEPEEDAPKAAIKKIVKNKEKSKKQRRRAADERKRIHMLKLAKVEKKKNADINKIKNIVKNIENEVEDLQAKKTKKKEKLLARKNAPKRLCAKKFVEPPTEYVPPAKLTNNLRNIQTRTNLLKDRQISLQKRNILQPTSCNIKKKKRKVKRYAVK